VNRAQSNQGTILAKLRGQFKKLRFEVTPEERLNKENPPPPIVLTHIYVQYRQDMEAFLLKLLSI
jgi:hypothetical protein